MCELKLQSANIVEVLILKSCFDVQIGELNYYIIIHAGFSFVLKRYPNTVKTYALLSWP